MNALTAFDLNNAHMLSTGLFAGSVMFTYLFKIIFFYGLIAGCGLNFASKNFVRFIGTTVFGFIVMTVLFNASVLQSSSSLARSSATMSVISSDTYAGFSPAASISKIITFRDPGLNAKQESMDTYGTTTYEVLAALGDGSDVVASADTSNIAGPTFDPKQMTVFVMPSTRTSDSDSWRALPAAGSQYGGAFSKAMMFAHNTGMRVAFASAHHLDAESLFDSVVDWAASQGPANSPEQTKQAMLDNTYASLSGGGTVALRAPTYQHYPGGVSGYANRLSTIVKNPMTVFTSKTADASSFIDPSKSSIGRMDSISKKYGYDSNDTGVSAEYYLQTHIPLYESQCAQEPVLSTAENAQEFMNGLNPCATFRSRPFSYLSNTPGKMASVKGLDQALEQTSKTVDNVSQWLNNGSSWKAIGGAASFVSGTFNLPVTSAPACTTAKSLGDLKHIYEEWSKSEAPQALSRRGCLKLAQNISAAQQAIAETMDENDDVIDSFYSKQSSYALEASSVYAVSVNVGTEALALHEANFAGIDNVLQGLEKSILTSSLPPVQLKSDIVVENLSAPSIVSPGMAAGTVATLGFTTAEVSAMVDGKASYFTRAWDGLKNLGTKAVTAVKSTGAKVANSSVRALKSISPFEWITKAAKWIGVLLALLPVIAILSLYATAYFTVTAHSMAIFALLPIASSLVYARMMTSTASDEAQGGVAIFPVMKTLAIPAVVGLENTAIGAAGPLVMNFFHSSVGILLKSLAIVGGALVESVTLGVFEFDITGMLLNTLKPLGAIFVMFAVAIAAQKLLPGGVGSGASMNQSASAAMPSIPAGGGGGGGGSNKSDSGSSSGSKSAVTPTTSTELGHNIAAKS